MDPERTLASTGELRPSSMSLLDGSGLDLLLSAPGLTKENRVASSIAQDPARGLAVRIAHEGWLGILNAFADDIARLPKATSWEVRIRQWVDALEKGTLRARFWNRAPLFSRVVSRTNESLVLSEPIHERLDDVAHELRFIVRGAEHARVREWFRERFDEANDVSSDVIACLRASWAGSALTPQEAYLKVLVEYFAPIIEGLDAELDDNPMLSFLTQFQVEAYHYAKSIVSRYGGVFLADVVGLGKTYTAMALLCHFQRRYKEHAVVVAPPKILPAWEELAREFRVEIALVSSGRLSDLEKYADREVLVVDESHNFRNVDTGKYEQLSWWLRPAGAPSHRKVLLLSATPQNNSPADIRSQLGFFPDNFTRLPFRGESIDSWFKEVRTGQAKLGEMLQHVVVRRTRGYIKSNYPDAMLKRRVAPGQYEEIPLCFPDRISGEDQCLRYSLVKTYHGRIYEHVLSTLSSLHYPLHSLARYVTPEALSDSRVAGLGRPGSNLRGLFKVLVLKRLESSIHAFRQTLKGLASRLEGATECLTRGMVPARASESSDSADEEDDDVESVTESELPHDLFRVDQLAHDVREDLAQVRALLALIEGLGKAEDDKIRRLKLYLTDRSPRAHKTLIFTQFADTAEYLGQCLGNDYGRTAVVTGAKGGALSAARRFAPRANRQNASEQEIDLLITTDVLSEGVNLQDADTLVNYDLHWNPVRLIQRAGRIDRIGSEHAAIHIASFLPEGPLEDGLGLEQVVRRRIAEFIAVFGEDSHVLPGGVGIEEHEIVNTYTGRALAGDMQVDELDGLSRHADRLLQLRRSEPDVFASILALRGGKRATSSEALPDIAATRLGWYWVFWNVVTSRPEQIETLAALDTLYRLGGGTSRITSAEETAVQLSRCAAVEADFAPLAETFRAQRIQPRLTPPVAFALRRLEEYLTVCVESRRNLAERLLSWVREGSAQPILSRQARNWKRDGWTPEMVFNECRALHARIPIHNEILGEPELVAASFGTRSELGGSRAFEGIE